MPVPTKPKSGPREAPNEPFKRAITGCLRAIARQPALAVFETVEQARVESIGAQRMVGVARNLTAMLDDRFHRGKFEDISERADAPIEDAIALIVRERLT